MIRVINITKRYGGTTVVDNVCFDFKIGQVYSIVGSSGSGKSTFLKCIARLEELDDGHIQYGNILQKEIGFIFQHFNLFTHMTILENLIYAPQQVLRINKQDAIKSARCFLGKVNLDPSIESQYPSNISGGQKQRVAIARTLCMKPKVILYDEPTSALDPENTIEVLRVIKNLSKSENLLSIIVTHHMKFAQSISDEIIFFDQGQIVETNFSKDFFMDPKSSRLKFFLSKVKEIDCS